MHPVASYFIEKLKLTEHPEGGYFREIYKSDEILIPEHLPDGFNKPHSLSTSIYFLLEGNQLSRLHKLLSDEIWHYHAGTRALLYIINDSGELIKRWIGNNPSQGDEFQLVIKKGSWFCAEVEDKSSFILVGCTVSPGFEFDDFTLADRAELISKFPMHKDIIFKFT